MTHEYRMYKKYITDVLLKINDERIFRDNKLSEILNIESVYKTFVNEWESVKESIENAETKESLEIAADELNSLISYYEEVVSKA